MVYGTHSSKLFAETETRLSYQARFLLYNSMRINLFGGPGTGKSTISPWLFSELKHRRVPIEFAPEYIKHWVYSGHEVKDFDQVYLFAKQQQAELRFLNNGVKNVITDSPCLLPHIYATLSPYEGNKWVADTLFTLHWKYEAMFPSFNIFLQRNPDPAVYNPEGRFQDFEGAKQADDLIMQYYDASNPRHMLGYYDKKQEMLDAILAVVDR
jgi:hypothetical protein